MRTKTTKAASQVKKTAKKPVKEREAIDTSILVPTGSTLLNLACSDSARGGFVPGKMVNWIGDSSSGKTLGLLSMFAEMARLKVFHDYKLHNDDVERANEFNIKNLFGGRAAKRIVSPPGGDSETMQDFQDNVLSCLTAGFPFVYGLDSCDALTCEEEEDKAEKDMLARAKGKEVKGSYNMAKPKMISQMLRLICAKLKATKSLLVIISQTRDDINPMSFTKKTRSGGRALKFYATHEIWMAVVGNITKIVHGRKRIIGTHVRAKVTKNKITGKVREVDFPVYYDYGIDDVGSCVDFLVAEGTWKKEGKTTIVTNGLEDYGMKGPRASVIEFIEDNNLEPKLVKQVAATWAEIEESLKLNRKRKYT